MPRHGRGKQIGPVDVDGPQLAHAVDRIRNSLKILGEAGRGHEAVNLAVAGDDLGDAGVDARGI
jgi:hypothetical protein